MIAGLCRGSGASMGGVQGGRSRGRKVTCPVCGRRVGMRPGRAGRLYPHAAEESPRKGSSAAPDVPMEET